MIPASVLAIAALIAAANAWQGSAQNDSSPAVTDSSAVVADSSRSGPSRSVARRPPAHALALGRIGRSGLRSLLSASGNLGDLQNRAGSYRLASQVERARVAALSGLISGLEAALRDPGLPAEERAILASRIAQARHDLDAVPLYEARYGTATAQVEGLIPSGFLGDRPLFLLVRGRGHFRDDRGDGLTVFSEGVSLGPVVVGGDRWILSPALSVGRTDVRIAPFDGESGTTSLGATLNAGVLGGGWSAALQVAHAWARARSRIVRPGPEGDAELRTEGWSRALSAKGEIKGRLGLGGEGSTPLALRPRLGVFLVSTYPAAGPSPGADAPSGAPASPGRVETTAALRAGASLETVLGPVSPALYLGWEQELSSQPASAIDDPRALLGTLGVSWSWAPGRRVSADWGVVRGLHGLRRVTELTLVLVLDG